MFLQIDQFISIWPVYFNLKLYLTYFRLSPCQIEIIDLLLSIPLVLDALPNFFPRLSFHYLFLIPILFAVLPDLLKP